MNPVSQAARSISPEEFAESEEEADERGSTISCDKAALRSRGKGSEPRAQCFPRGVAVGPGAWGRWLLHCSDWTLPADRSPWAIPRRVGAGMFGERGPRAQGRIWRAPGALLGVRLVLFYVPHVLSASEAGRCARCGPFPPLWAGSEMPLTRTFSSRTMVGGAAEPRLQAVHRDRCTG